MPTSDRLPATWSTVGVRRITVAPQPGPVGAAALDWAADEARIGGGRLARWPAPPAASPARRGSSGSGAVTVERFAGDDGVDLVALSRHCDLLVLGADRFEAPSLGPALMRAACPVVVVRPDPGGTAREPFAGHVVVAVDDTAAAAVGLRFGFAHARRHHRPLTAVHVDAGPAGDFWFDERYLETCFTAEPPALTLLARQVEPVGLDYPDVAVKRAVFCGDVAAGLHRAAAGATLVVCTRHRGPAAPGPVLRALLVQPGCPVAIVPELTEADRPANASGRRATRRPS